MPFTRRQISKVDCMIFFVACRAARGVIGIYLYTVKAKADTVARGTILGFSSICTMCAWVGAYVCIHERQITRVVSKGYRDYAICRMGIYGVFYFLLSSRGAALPVMTMRINGLWGSAGSSGVSVNSFRRGVELSITNVFYLELVTEL